MNLIEILFVLLAFSFGKALVLNEAEPGAISFPAISEVPFSVSTPPSSCSGFTDCIEFVGLILLSFVQGILFIVFFLFNLIVFVFELLVVFAEVTFTGIDGAPFWVNGLLMLAYPGALAITIFKMFRKGDANAG